LDSKRRRDVSTFFSFLLGTASVCALLLIRFPAARAQDETEPQAEVAVAATDSSPDASAEPPQKEKAKDPSPKRLVLPPAHHRWARFQPGAWRELRVTTETFDNEGKVVSQSVTTQQEVLEGVNEESYEFDIQATVDLSGKRIAGEWKSRVLHLATDSAGQIVDARQLEEASLSVGGQPVDCQVWEIRYNEDARTLVDRIYYAPELFPYILQRETSEADDAAGDRPRVGQTTKVVALEVPYVVDGRIAACSCIQTIRSSVKGNTVRVVFESDEVPGGEVAAWSTDYDDQGRRTKWSVLELLSYGEAPPEESRIRFRGLRGRAKRRSGRKAGK